MESTTYHLDLLLLCLLGSWSRLCVNLKKLYLKKIKSKIINVNAHMTTFNRCQLFQKCKKKKRKVS